MRAIAPRIPDAGEVTFSEEQPEYKPITVALRGNSNYPSGTEIVTRWTFSPDERRRVADGADIFVSQLSFGKPMTPLNVTLDEITEPFNPSKKAKR